MAALCHSLANLETQRRVTRSLLALEAWKLEHGDLPQSLEALRGKYLERPPVDPFGGEPFHYYPKGVEFAFRDARGNAIGPRTPFLWGLLRRTVGATWSDGYADASAKPPADRDTTTSTLERVLPLGCAFAIP